VIAGRVAAAVIALAVLARALVRYRRGRIGRGKVAAWTALAAALAVYAAGVLSPLPSPERILGGLAGAIGPYAYLLVGALAYLETAAFLGLITPGELTMLLGGVVAARGDVSIVPLVGLVWLCSVLGDSTGYLLGRRLGRSFLVRHGDRFHLGPERLERVEGFFDRRGGSAIVIARFVGPLRTLAPFVAGSSRMRYRRFLPYTLVGTGLWSTTFLLLGYFFYASFARVAELAGRTGGVLGAAIVVIGGSVYAYRRLRHPEERRRLRDWWETQSRRPALRPLARVAGLARPDRPRAGRPGTHRSRPLRGEPADPWRARHRADLDAGRSRRRTLRLRTLRLPPDPRPRPPHSPGRLRSERGGRAARGSAGRCGGRGHRGRVLVGHRRARGRGGAVPRLSTPVA
jgi:undecaprenyl-diphosphatase